MGTGPILILGIGNTLRRDDGAGLFLASAAAQEFEKWGFTAVEAHRHQLTPEVAAEIAELRPSLVLFTDVQVGGVRPQLTSVPATARPDQADSHHSSPAVVLNLAHELYAVAPPGWLLTVPGVDFNHGDGLAAPTQDAIPAAVRLLEELIHNSSKT